MPTDNFFPEGYFPDESPPEYPIIDWTGPTLWTWGLALLLSTLASLVLVVLLLRRDRGPMAVAILLLAVHLPFFVGMYGATYKTIVFNQLVAMGPWRREPGRLARCAAEALIMALFGIVLMSPAYATALIGSLVKAIRQPGPSKRDLTEQRGTT